MLRGIARSHDWLECRMGIETYATSVSGSTWMRYGSIAGKLARRTL